MAGLSRAVVWMAFIACMVTGAGLTWHPDGRLQVIGITLIALPLVVFSGLTGLYYARQRNARRDD